MKPALEALVEQELATLGFELVELRRTGIARRPVLDVRIDRSDGTKVSIDDCASVSRALEPRLDASGLIRDSYVLEVSSPGVERPLRHAADWQRFVGRRASVLCPQLGGRVEVEVLGAETVAEIDNALLRDTAGVEHRIPLSEIKEARLVFVWNK